MTEPCADTSPRTVSTADAASIERSRTTSVTKLLLVAPRDPTRDGCDAALSVGWMRNAPPVVGTATRPLARSVDRKISKYSERDNGWSVTTVTLPLTRESMMNVRPVTRAASAMKARISASRTFIVCCAVAVPAISAAMTGVRISFFIGPLS